MSTEDSYTGKAAYRGDVALTYDRDRAGQRIWQREQKWMENWARTIPRGARVLDVPTGTGRFVDLLRARGADVYAVDISEDMLAELRRQFQPHGRELVIERADAEALPYAAGAFDFVVCWRLFHLLPEAPAQRVLKELARVCCGQIVLEVFAVQTGGMFRRVARTLKACTRAWLKSVARRSSPALAPWSHITNYPHRDRVLIGWFRECGLRVVATDTLADEQGPPARIYLLERKGTIP